MKEDVEDDEDEEEEREVEEEEDGEEQEEARYACRSRIWHASTHSTPYASCAKASLVRTVPPVSWKARSQPPPYRLHRRLS